MARQQRPIRIGNASGAIGDGIDQIYELARIGGVDAITADYLAEFNIAWRAIELQAHPERGYEPSFLDQLAWNDGDAARLVVKKGIKIVHDGGALNPRGLAEATDSYFKSLGLNNVKIAWVGGDNVTERVRNGKLGRISHLDQQGVELQESDLKDILAANAYTGQAGIVRALEEGADIIICGRCCDASPVMGLASWWHGWGPEDYDKHAAGLMAGHLIECGPYVTGGNFCGAPEIETIHSLGYPIAEIGEDGKAVITKPAGTNGAVTVDTCKAQLLYEIQGPNYLNPDVIAHIEDVCLKEVGENRVEISGVRGSAPPATTKLAVCRLGGWQGEVSWYCAGLDTDFKFQQAKDGLLKRINMNDFSTLSVEKYGSSQPNPRTQGECTVQLRVFAQAPRKESFAQLKKGIFFNGMQGFSGLHISMDWRTLEPRMFVKYYPGLVAQSEIPLTVHFTGSDSERTAAVKPRPTNKCAVNVPAQRSYEPKEPLGNHGETIKRPLGDLVFARSGDKGGNANVGFWVRDASAWPWLQSFLTSDKLIELLGDEWDNKFSVERCEFANIWAVHFVVKGFLQDGVSSSSILDGFAKSFGEFLRARHVDLPQKLVRLEDQHRDRGRSAAGRLARL